MLGIKIKVFQTPTNGINVWLIVKVNALDLVEKTLWNGGSELVERKRRWINREPESECDLDRAANERGRKGDPEKSCEEVCDVYRQISPADWSPRYPE
jgi:hypothetical protein